MTTQTAKKIDTRVRDKDFVRKPGKTAKDAANGAKARNVANKEERAIWSRLDNQERDNRNFPLSTCNGKKACALKVS